METRIIMNEPLHLFLVEDDLLFAKVLQSVAKTQNIHIDVFHPEFDFDNLPLDGTYDVGLIDFDLVHLNGTQIASLYDITPLLLISANPENGRSKIWPKSVQGFSAKNDGFPRLFAKIRVVASQNPFITAVAE